jgi:hypothetical protein
MSEPLKIALTAVAGIVIFVLGQIIQRLFIEPIQDQRRTVGKVIHALTYLSNVSTMTDGGGFYIVEDTKTAHKQLRGLASDLRASLRVIPFYRVLELVRLVEKGAVIEEASTALIGWSNSLGRDEGRQVHQDRLTKLLRA